MAKSILPNPLARRHLLEREISREQALRIAEAYLEQRRSWEAIAFLVKAQARDRLQQIQAAAVEEGDSFLLREVSRALGEDPGAERWRQLATAAGAAGKQSYAVEARRQAERGEG
jgi:hypothetical protein